MSKLRWSLRLHNGRGIEGGQNACMIRDKFGLQVPNQFKYGRSQGGISNIELEKLGIG